MVSLFTTPEHGTMIQDSFPMNRTFNSFLGFQVPYFYFSVKADEAVKNAASGGECHLLYYVNLVRIKQFFNLQRISRDHCMYLDKCSSCLPCVSNIYCLVVVVLFKTFLVCAIYRCSNDPTTCCC